MNKDVIILALGKVTQVAISLASIRIMTEWLSEKEISNYYLLISLVSLFGFVLYNSFGQYYARFLLEWKRRSVLKLITISFIWYRLYTVPLVLFISWAVFYLLNYENSFNFIQYSTCIVLSCISSSFGFLISSVNILSYRRDFVLYTIYQLILGLVLSILLCITLGYNGTYWLVGQYISQMIFIPKLYSIVCGDEHIKKGKSFLDIVNRRELFIFCAPVIFTLFLQWGSSNLYRFIVEFNYGPIVFSQIAVGLALANSVFRIMESLFNQYVNPIFYKRISNVKNEQRAEVWNDIAKKIIPLYIIMAMFLCGSSRFITQVLVSNTYHDAYKYVIIGALIELFRVLNNLFYLVSQSEVKTGSTIYPYLISIIYIIISLTLFDYSNHIELVAVNVMIASALSSTFMYYMMKRISEIKINIVELSLAVLFSLPLIIPGFYDFHNLAIQVFSLIISVLYLIGLFLWFTKKRNYK